MTPDGWKLPEGWTSDAPEHMPGCVVIENEDNGRVTVDLRNRVFGLGIGRPVLMRGLFPEMTFAGKGWQHRLMDAAVDYLMESAK